jgi:hypothetical protein
MSKLALNDEESRLVAAALLIARDDCFERIHLFDLDTDEDANERVGARHTIDVYEAVLDRIGWGAKLRAVYDRARGRKRMGAPQISESNARMTDGGLA